MIFFVHYTALAYSSEIIRSYNQIRLDANAGVSLFLGNAGRTCAENTLANWHHNQVSCGEQPSSDELSDLSQFLNNVNLNLREKQFITRARNEQLSHLNCEINQLQSFRPNGIFKSFYRDLMKSLCIRIPDLRAHYQKMAALRDEVKVYDNLLDPPGKDYYNPFFEDQKNEWREKKEKLFADYRVEQSKFELIKSSTWRFGDPIMLGYIHKAMDDNEVYQRICQGGNPNTNSATQTEIYQEFYRNVIGPMLSQAREDKASLRSSTADIGPKQMNMLLNRSSWENYLDQDLSRNENELLMCHIDRRYLSGNDLTNNVLGVASFATGGPFLFLKAARWLRFAGKFKNVRMPWWGNVLVLAPGIPFSLNVAQDACTEPEQAYEVHAPTCPMSSGGGLDINRMVQIERTKLANLNCALGATVGIISPSLAYLVNQAVGN